MTLHSINVEGRTVLSYMPYSQSPATAEEATALLSLDVVVPAVLDQLAGWWLTSASDELTDALLGAGATLVRHGHLYRRAITAEDRVLDPEVPDGLVLEPLHAARSLQRV